MSALLLISVEPKSCPFILPMKEEPETVLALAEFGFPQGTEKNVDPWAVDIETNNRMTLTPGTTP